MTILPFLLFQLQYQPYLNAYLNLFINELGDYITDGIKNAQYKLYLIVVVEGQNKLQDIKQNIKSKINDIDQMLNDLNSDENVLNKADDINKIIEINQLDLVDVLSNILNQHGVFYFY